MDKSSLMLVVGFVLAGCAELATNTSETVESNPAAQGGRAYQRHDCKYVRLKSIFGLSDDVLADTNRFQLGEAPYGIRLDLDKPFLGCKEARVYLDEMVSPSRTSGRSKAHQLRSVKLERTLPDDAGSEVLLREAKSIVAEISKWLGVGMPEVELVDVSRRGKNLKRIRSMSGSTSVRFKLAEGQDIEVRLIEGLYVMRDGVPRLVDAPSIKIDIAYNPELEISASARSMRRMDGEKRQGEKTRVDKEIDIGPDCSDKFAQAFRDAMRNGKESAEEREVRRNEPQQELQYSEKQRVAERERQRRELDQLRQELRSQREVLDAATRLN